MHLPQERGRVVEVVEELVTAEERSLSAGEAVQATLFSAVTPTYQTVQCLKHVSGATPACRLPIETAKGEHV